MSPERLAAIVCPLRSFIFKPPDEYGMEYQELVIPSDDGVPLEAWYIPAKEKSDKLIIFNHPMPMCRAGFPRHFGMPWAVFDAVEIDFIIQYKHLTDAGYNVLTYDIRNHGNSGVANGSISGIGNWEWRDCVGVKKWVDAHPELGKMTVGLYSQCMGGFTAAEMTPHLSAPFVHMPTLIVQVKDDSWTRNPEDGQKTFDLLASKEKEIFWIEGTTRRFKDGYNWFGREPKTVLDFFAKYMK